MAKGWSRGGWLPLALCFAGLLAVCSVIADTEEVASTDTVFYDSFDQHFDSRWVVSDSGDYKGVWKHEQSEGHEDYGLLVSEKAKKHGIAIDLPETVYFKDEPVILQYDVRLQTGLECGGAYLKYLLPQEGWTPSQFDNTAPYSIMFGPDKCGSTNKVHFIYRHKSPKTGEFIEHHVKNPPSIAGDKLSHVYTAVIYPNNTLKMLVDGEEKKSADLLSHDFEPAVIPPKTIPDPEDKKPEDWDERAKISDPDATKPDDWDENAPREIEDLEAEKPEGWLDDEPDEVDDPEAEKPEDWDEDEDGEWEAPKVPNPKCEEAPGCGEWVRPTTKNPAYKGRWSAPMITNPAYKGIWKARDIDNPDYFELEKPNLEPLAAIGIEIWTMQDGILFDNILITRSEEEAAEYRETTWKPKFDSEKVKQEDEEKVPEPGAITSAKDKVFEVLYDLAELPFLSAYKEQITDFIGKAEKHKNLTLLGLFGALLGFLAILQSLLFRKKTVSPVSVAKKEDITTPDDLVAEKTSAAEKIGEPVEGTVDDADATGEIEKDDEPSTTRRRNRRET